MVYGYKDIWKIAGPILLGMVIQQLVGVTDVVFLGRVGQTELGASAIAGLYYITIYMLGVGFGIGVQILIARLNGSGKKRQIAPLFYQSMGLMLVFAVAAIILSYLLLPLILPLLISSGQVLSAAWEYLYFRVWGFVFSFAIVVFRAFYVGIVNTRVLSVSAAAMLLVNMAGFSVNAVFPKWASAVRRWPPFWPRPFPRLSLSFTPVLKSMCGTTVLMLWGILSRI